MIWLRPPAFAWYRQVSARWTSSAVEAPGPRARPPLTVKLMSYPATTTGAAAVAERTLSATIPAPRRSLQWVREPADRSIKTAYQPIRKTRGRPSSWKQPYFTRGVRALLARYAAAAGLPHNMPPHRLRHFLFTWLKTQGIDDALIQPYSGHASRQSLEIYSRLALADAQHSYDEGDQPLPGLKIIPVCGWRHAQECRAVTDAVHGIPVVSVRTDRLTPSRSDPSARR